MTRRFALAIIAAITLIAGGAAAPIVAAGQATPTPIQQTPPPDVAAPSPTPEPLLVNGQVIDLERGYVVFASGDAFKLAPTVTIADDASGAVPNYALNPGFYAVATLDAVSGQVIALRTSRRPLAAGTPAAEIPRRYVIAASSPIPNKLQKTAKCYKEKLDRMDLKRQGLAEAEAKALWLGSEQARRVPTNGPGC